jgi:hypothetical protein
MSAAKAADYVTAFIAVIEGAGASDDSDQKTSRAQALRLVDDLRACNRDALAARVATAVDRAFK